MIYKASFINPVDGQHDTIDTDKIDMISLNNSFLVSSEKEYEIKYTFSYNNELIELKGEINGMATSIAFIEPQLFTDEMSRCIHTNKLPDSSDSISDAKAIIANQFRDTLLIEGITLKDVPYDTFGFVYSMGDKIGTFESIEMRQNKSIKFTHLLSIIELENAKDISFEFILSGNKYSSTASCKEKDILTYDNLIIEKTTEVYDVVSKDDYACVEDMYEDRRKLVSSMSVEDNTSVDEFNDLF